MIDLQEICKNVCVAARSAGQLMLDERKNFSLDKVEHKGVHDYVSYVDRKAEELIIKHLSPLIPSAGFITEEATTEQSKAEYTWVIDPLDGTTNYIHGLSPYSVSIALLKDEQAIVGVVYIPTSDECFHAVKDGKARLNDMEIKPSTRTKVKESLLITGFPYKVGDKIEAYLEMMRYLTFNSHGVRRLGSAAADLVYVACGRAEVFYQTDLKPWDVAAGAFIAMRAGAAASDFRGGNDFMSGRSILVSGTSELNEEMLGLVRKFFEKHID
ncbi:MAG: inositol monophosphatase [Prevotellaceae bacterium]|jgi:myo-inositol-1(or 4)-monophosphatase|nr:inositol monophosphatase [Prevotellaceae bacterium]